MPSFNTFVLLLSAVNHVKSTAILADPHYIGVANCFLESWIYWERKIYQIGFIRRCDVNKSGPRIPFKYRHKDRLSTLTGWETSARQCEWKFGRASGKQDWASGILYTAISQSGCNVRGHCSPKFFCFFCSMFNCIQIALLLGHIYVKLQSTVFHIKEIIEEYLRLHWRGYGRDNLFIYLKWISFCGKNISFVHILFLFYWN